MCMGLHVRLNVSLCAHYIILWSLSVLWNIAALDILNECYYTP